MRSGLAKSINSQQRAGKFMFPMFLFKVTNLIKICFHYMAGHIRKVIILIKISSS